MYISIGNRERELFTGPMLVLVFLMAVFPEMQSQEPAFYAQYRFNKMIYNPAWAGDRDIPGLSLLSRQQWLSWEGSPSANHITFHSRLPDKNVGVGLSLEYEQMGPLQHVGLKGMYAYTLELANEGKLLMGIQGELRLLQLKIAQLEVVDQGDPLYGDDPGMKLQPNAGLGASYVQGRFSMGLSMPRMLNSALSPFEGESSSLSRMSRIVYLDLGWQLAINENISFDPALLLAFSSGRSPLIELSGLLHVGEKFGMGAMFRFDQTIGGMIRYKYQDKYLFGYSYDLSLGKLQTNVGTHEIYLAYNLPFNQYKTMSPRRF